MVDNGEATRDASVSSRLSRLDVSSILGRDRGLKKRKEREDRLTSHHPNIFVAFVSSSSTSLRINNRSQPRFLAMRIKHDLHEVVRRLVRFPELSRDDVLTGGLLVNREERGFEGCERANEEERRVENRISFNEPTRGRPERGKEKRETAQIETHRQHRTSPTGNRFPTGDQGCRSRAQPPALLWISSFPALLLDSQSTRT